MTDSELLAAAKNYCDITWQDESTDSKLSGIVARGKARLQKVAGSALTFSVESPETALLLDYCLYALASALSEWETAYKSDLIALRIQSLIPGGDPDGKV